MATAPDYERDQIQSIKVSENVNNPYKDSILPTFAPGFKIGPNRVELMIGEGGSATVYKVWHEGLEVIRAVKVLKKYTNKEARERFFTEAKILADIHHPNIIEIHNIGYLDQSVPFLEMEYVDGFSIKSMLGQHVKLPISVALAVAYFVSHALRYTHIKDYTIYGKVYHGLIHRDIKPDNIIISNDGIVKLMDFGIARPSEVSLHTIGQKIMGTLIYLSPEQLNGKQLDLRSDIFSLGAVLYEMLSGHRAFPQKVLSELVQKKTKAEYRSLSSLGVCVPPEIEAIISKSMALDPNERYANCADFGQDIFSVYRNISDRAPQDVLSRFMSNPSSITDVKTVPVNTKKGSKSSSFIENNKALVYIAGGAIIAVAAAIIFKILS